MNSTRGVVIAGQPGISTNILFNALDKQVGVESIIIEKPPASWQILRRRSKRLGFFRTASQALFRGGIVPILTRQATRRRQDLLTAYQLDDHPIPDTRTMYVDSVNHQQTRDHLEELNPNIVVLSGTRIVAPPTLACIPAHFINMHAGLTPSYRGVHGGYWALACGEPEACGVTIHLVDRGIDTGNILEQAIITPTPEDNFATYPLLQLAEGLPLLVRTVQAILNEETLQPLRTSRPSALWHHPTVGEYLHNRILKNVP
ncbi:MAG: formyl transferase [Myxococcales bacterium]|nr:formyl transferase [Myxococcales bacterium]